MADYWHGQLTKPATKSTTKQEKDQRTPPHENNRFGLNLTHHTFFWAVRSWERNRAQREDAPSQQIEA